MDRRAFLRSGAGAGLALAASCTHAKPVARYQGGVSPWPIVLNTSTIRPASLRDKINAAAEAGYDGIEPWVEDLEKYEAEGGDLNALGRQIRDKGLFVPNVIGLWECMPAGEDAWQASLPATRNRMRMCAAIGSQHVAAIPAPDRADFDLKWGADRYRDLLQIGREEYGLVVAFEFVGFFKGVHRLGQACAVAVDACDADACLIADTFHLYRGGSGFDGLCHLDGAFIANFHWNDVPASPPREELGDQHRIYPGDGILPLRQVLESLKGIGYTGPLSLELFNREHWEQDPKVVAETGLRKIMGLMAPAART